MVSKKQPTYEIANIQELLSALDKHGRRISALEANLTSVGDFVGYNLLRKPQPGYQWTIFIEPSEIYCFADSLGHSFAIGKRIEFAIYVANELKVCGNIDAGTEAILDRPFTINSYVTASHFFLKYGNLQFQR